MRKTQFASLATLGNKPGTMSIVKPPPMPLPGDQAAMHLDSRMTDTSQPRSEAPAPGPRLIRSSKIEDRQGVSFDEASDYIKDKYKLEMHRIGDDPAVEPALSAGPPQDQQPAPPPPDDKMLDVAKRWFGGPDVIYVLVALGVTLLPAVQTRLCLSGKYSAKHMALSLAVCMVLYGFMKAISLAGLI
jgi:hypothetical protein